MAGVETPAPAPKAAGRVSAEVSEDLLAHPAADAFRAAEARAIGGDHLAARLALRAIEDDSAVPVAIRAEARALRRELSPDPVAVAIGSLALLAVVFVWWASATH